MAIPTEQTAPESNDRNRVITFLAFLTSEECQAACRRHTRQEELAALLSRTWFDEIYVPGETYLEGLKGDRTTDDLTRFKTHFSSAELASLARFHGFFELRLEFITNRTDGRSFFPDNDSWRSLVKHATYVLNELEPRAEHIQRILATVVNEALQSPVALQEVLRRPRLLRN